MKKFTVKDMYRLLSDKDGIVHITDGDYNIRMNKDDFDTYFSEIQEIPTLSETIDEFKSYDEQNTCHEVFKRHPEYFRFLLEKHDKNMAKL